VKFKIITFDHAENFQTRNGEEAYYIYWVIPEFSSTTVLLFMILTIFAIALLDKFLVEEKLTRYAG